MICSQPPGKTYPSLNRPIPPKIAIGPNPPFTEDFQKSPIPLNPGGFPLCDYQ